MHACMHARTHACMCDVLQIIPSCSSMFPPYSLQEKDPPRIRGHTTNETPPYMYIYKCGEAFVSCVFVCEKEGTD